MTRHVLLWSLTIIFSLFVAAEGSWKSYRGYKLFQVTPQTDAQEDALHDIRDQSSKIDFFTRPRRNMAATFAVPPAYTAMAFRLLQFAGMKPTVTDLHSLLDRDRQGRKSKVAYAAGGKTTPPLSHDAYRNLEEIVEALQSLASHYGPDAKLSTIDPKTHEGRNIYTLEIDVDAEKLPDKPVIIVESLMHAREWVAGAAVLYVIDQLLSRYPNDSDAQHALSTYKWIFIPVSNPDGYHFSWTRERLWRKNRRPALGGNSECIGVDVNRNFDFDFGVAERERTSKCADNLYAGPYPFSEPESRSIRNLVQRVRSRLQAYVSLHSFSQLLFCPWGLKRKEKPLQHEEHDRVGSLMMEALCSFGTNYSFGEAEQLVGYPVSGDATDWTYSVAPWIYAYVYELRPNIECEEGFILPPQQIVPTGKELYASLMTMAREMKLFGGRVPH